MEFQVVSEQEWTPEQQLRRSLSTLRLEVAKEIADDVERIVNAALSAADEAGWQRGIKYVEQLRGYLAAEKRLTFEAQQAALKEGIRSGELEQKYERAQERAKKWFDLLAIDRDKVHRCEVIHRHRDTIELLKDQVKMLVEALQQILESDCMITTSSVLMKAHRENMEIARAAVLKVKETK